MKTERLLVVKCTLGELMGWGEPLLGRGVSYIESDLINSLNGEYRTNYLFNHIVSFQEFIKTNLECLCRISFGNSELFLRFSRAQTEHQGAFLERVCNILWKNSGEGVLEIEVQWSASKKRTIKAEKTRWGLNGYEVRLSLI